jgi:dTDP-4-dehydrorhamnose 3,5-epimerase
MKITQTELPGVLLIEPTRHGDERGLFVETFKADELAKAGVAISFIQDNLARSSAAGVVRGLHFQKPPFAQDKLIRCCRGAILDVAVDIRPGSPTFGRSVAVELSAENWLQLLVPAGFAHGYCTLTPDTEVAYKVSGAYAPQSEGGLLWNDPALGIAWPIAAEQATLNARDKGWPTLAELQVG